MAPGPTMVRGNVRFARAEETTNPDIDLAFYEFYKQNCNNTGDFVKIYVGNPIYFRGSRTKKIDIDELRLLLEKDRNFKYATVIHCDILSGVLNEIDKICPLLKEYGIITVVDRCSSYWW